MKYKQLTENQRYQVYSLKKAGHAQQQIAKLIGRSISTISRELRRHSHETIYQLIYADKAQGGDLHKHLRIASKAYRKRYGHYDRRGKIKDRVSIEKRPEVVDKRSCMGNWEGDIIIGKGRSGALVTLVERKTLYTVILRVPGKYATPLAKTVVAAMKPLAARIKTITLDNGLEFAGHAILAKKLNAAIYFAHPYASR